MRSNSKTLGGYGIGVEPSVFEDDQWLRDKKFAVMKGTNKKATKLFDLSEDAHRFIANHKNGGEMRVDFRPGTRVRCENYCDVKQFCEQYKLENK